MSIVQSFLKTKMSTCKITLTLAFNVAVKPRLETISTINKSASTKAKVGQMQRASAADQGKVEDVCNFLTKT